MSFDAFVAAGLYDPDAPNADERRAYLEYLLERGFTAEEICAVDRSWPISDLLAVLSSQPIALLSAREIAARTDLRVEDIEELRALLGMPVDSPDSNEIAESFVQDVALHQLAVAMYGKERTQAFTRVMGSAISALMEASREMAWTPLRDVPMTEIEIAQANEAAMAAWQVLPEMLGHLLMERASRDTWFEEQLRRGAVSMGVAFVDLVGSTSWTASLSPADHAAALNRFESMAVRAASRHGSRVVKFIGDEAMLVGVDAARVAEAAAELSAAIGADDGLPGARAAVGWGPVTPRGGDYFGDVVNTVARATKEAAVGGVVATAEVAKLLDGLPNWTLGPARDVHLRGLNSEITLRPVTRAHDQPE